MIRHNKDRRAAARLRRETNDRRKPKESKFNGPTYRTPGPDPVISEGFAATYAKNSPDRGVRFVTF